MYIRNLVAAVAALLLVLPALSSASVVVNGKEWRQLTGSVPSHPDVRNRYTLAPPWKCYTACANVHGVHA